MSKVWRCSYESVCQSVLIVNTFHVVDRPDALESDRTADQVRDLLHSALTTKYRALVQAGVTVSSLLVREELPPGDTGIPAESSQTIGLVGTLAGSDQNLPLSLCVLASVKTNAAVRSGHGRLFLPCPQSAGSLTTNGLWNTANAFWTNAGTFMTELNNNHGYADGGLTGHLATVVYSRTRRGRGDPNYYFDMTGYTLRTKPHWLRSRATAP